MTTSKPTTREVRRYWHDMRERGSKLLEYKALISKRYRTPQGYRDHADVALDIITVCYVLMSSKILSNISNFTERITCYLTSNLIASQAPVYWVSEKLLESILETELPQQVVIDHLQRSIRFATIILPKDKVYTPDNEEITYLSFEHYLTGDEVPAITTGKISITVQRPDSNGVMFFSITKEGTAYASNIELSYETPKDSEFNLSDSLSKLDSENNPKEAEQQFLETLRNIVLQSLLIMQSRPNLLEMGQPVGFGGVTKSGKTSLLNQLLNPNWIGRNYQPPRVRVDLGGTHASPRTHWRRGHTRLVAYGKGRTERRPHWIEPVLVNG